MNKIKFQRVRLWTVVVASITMEGGWGKQILKKAIFRHFPMETEIVCGHFDIFAY